MKCPEYKACAMREMGATCICPQCTSSDENSGPVCSTLKTTYNSLCELKLKACDDKSNEKLAELGACKRGKILKSFR